MIRHIVFFKLQDNSQENTNKVKETILLLKNKINFIKFYQVGVNFADEERAYDLALVSDFETKEDLKNYAKHPEHLKVISILKTMGIKTKVVDFEY
jgi:hypothetical protein